MEYFKKYVSNTVGGSSNQYYFSTDGEVRTGRIYYKIFEGGEYEYSLLFTNIIDSTFADGTYSHKNLICESWKLLSVKVGKCVGCSMTEAVEPEEFITLMFDNKVQKEVMPGEFFTTDPFMLDAKTGEFICLEMTYQGEMVPSHEELMLASFVAENGQWVPSKKLPVASMIGCNRKVTKKIGYLGDSITQGIGATPNNYTFWNALLSEKLGKDYSYWNIGIGYGRADDAASDGCWLFKAKQMDLVFLCFGVNDTNRGFTAEQIKNNLKTIIDKLHEKNIKVIIQSVPPFDYDEARKPIWMEVNAYIKETLSKIADGYFDTVPILSKYPEDPEKIQVSRYGGHPNDAGCAVWAEKLYEYVHGELGL